MIFSKKNIFWNNYSFRNGNLLESNISILLKMTMRFPMVHLTFLFDQVLTRYLFYYVKNWLLLILVSLCKSVLRIPVYNICLGELDKGFKGTVLN